MTNKITGSPAQANLAAVDSIKLQVLLTQALQRLHLLSIAAEKWARADTQTETELGESVLLELAEKGETTIVVLATELKLPAAELEALTRQEYGHNWRNYHLLEADDEGEVGEGLELSDE